MRLLECRLCELKNYILNNFELNELQGMYIYLLDEFKHQLGSELGLVSMNIVNTLFQDLEGDFRLLRKATSENITLNKRYSKKQLEKTKESGVGFYENKTMKEIIFASTRFGKEKFPEYLPETRKIINEIKITKDDIKEIMETKEHLKSEAKENRRSLES